MTNRGEKGSGMKAKIKKTSKLLHVFVHLIVHRFANLILHLPCPADRPCSGAALGATTPGAWRCRGRTSGAGFGADGKVSRAGWAAPFSQMGRRGMLPLPLPLQKCLAVLKNFPLLLCMRVGLQSSVNSSRIQQEILPGASLFELCLLRPRQRGRVWKAKCS